MIQWQGSLYGYGFKSVPFNCSYLVYEGVSSPVRSLLNLVNMDLTLIYRNRLHKLFFMRLYYEYKKGEGFYTVTFFEYKFISSLD